MRCTIDVPLSILANVQVVCDLLDGSYNISEIQAFEYNGLVSYLIKFSNRAEFECSLPGKLGYKKIFGKMTEKIKSWKESIDK